MPGIVGLITRKPRQQAEPELLRMVEALRHESFYVTGTWIDEAQGIYVGWAARKGSFADGMPSWNEPRNIVLAFAGEEFPDPETPRRLKESGHELDLEGSSYLVHLAEEDPAFPAGLNGRFHGLLVDRARGTATLFNDRFGMHRVYFHQGKESFYFAAEAKAILAVRPELRSADPTGLAELVSCGCVLNDRTLFQGIRILPGGSAWMFRNGSLAQEGTYFNPQSWQQQPPLEPEAYYQEVRRVFSQNLPRYFGGQERVGISLTGGLDTRMIMAWHKCLPGSLPCYTFGGKFRDSQDVAVARQVARSCEQPHEVIPVGEEFLAQFPRYAERTVYLTDGCVGVNHSADLYVNEQARTIAPVRMTGNYGGEVLRRVRAFRPEEPLAGLFRPEFLVDVRQAEETYNGLLREHPLSFALFQQAPWHHYGLLALEQTQLSLRSPFLDNDLLRTLYRAPESAVASNAVSLQLISDGNPRLAGIRTDRGLAGSNGSDTGAVTKWLLDFTFKAEYAYDYGMPQWVARIDHWLSPLHLERLFLGRHKFYHFRVWYRDALAKYVREMLLDPRTLSRPYLEPQRVEEIVAGHLKGGRNYTTAIHNLLTLELVHRLFIDSD